jgi:hypothetical protein
LAVPAAIVMDACSMACVSFFVNGRGLNQTLVLLDDCFLIKSSSSKSTLIANSRRIKLQACPGEPVVLQWYQRWYYRECL